uniref:Transposase domain-containing protein n=1 Tax=Trichogramma kaykai TaxID=54128 RepID=A0ABD2WXB7_9HYME
MAMQDSDGVSSDEANRCINYRRKEYDCDYSDEIESNDDESEDQINIHNDRIIDLENNDQDIHINPMAYMFNDHEYPNDDDDDGNNFLDENERLLEDIGERYPIEEDYNINDLKVKKNYFIQIPLRPQLEEFVNSKYDLISKSENTQKDFSNILSGQFYKKLKKHGKINNRDIILQMNTDGVKLFKSSAFTLWPIQMEIANLLYHDKRQNKILTALWFGNDKPEMNTFLKPTVDELKDLHEEGITLILNDEEINIKVHTIISSLDSPARCAVQNMKQYNGDYGCTFCYHRGDSIEVGLGHARIYPGATGQPRNLTNHLEHVQMAQLRNEPIFGVKGYSRCLEIPLFNIIDSCTVDYMHCVCLGVVKTLIDASFNSTFHGQSFYVGTRIKEVQDRFSNIKPPCEITRTPGEFIHRSNFKASEWKNILCYYLIPIFKDILPQNYLNHWLLLVAGIRILLQPKIYPNELEKAEELLNEFVLKIASLYPDEFYKYNVHLLLHLTKSVRLFGGLWDTSCFAFEHFNGVLAKMFKNSQSVPEQICKSYNRFRRIETASNTTFSSPECPVEVNDFYKSLTSHLQLTHNCIEESVDLKILGVGKLESLSMVEKVIIENLLGQPVDDYGTYFYRFVHRHIMWHGNDNNLLEKRNNSYALLQNESIVLIKCIVSVKNNNNDKKTIILANKCREIDDKKIKNIANYSKLRLSSSEIFKCCAISNDIIACYPENLDKKCVAVPINNLLFISPLVNNIERD